MAQTVAGEASRGLRGVLEIYSNTLAMIYASMGRYAEGADMLAKFPPGEISAAITKEAARLLR
jgi:hypothetical protein